VKNRLKQLLNAGEPALGAQLRFGSPAIAELFGAAGFDFVIIDGEHAPQSPAGIQAQMQGLASTRAAPLVRPGQNDPDLIRLYLDMGAAGVVVPFISTAEQAAVGARACRYPPAGNRGFGPSRAARYGFDDDYFQQANDNVVYLPLIETADAVDNIGEILAVDGVDAYIVGEYDLSISLGIPLGFDRPEFKDALRRVPEAGAEAGVPGVAALDAADATAEGFGRHRRQGTTLFLVDGDEWMLHAATRAVVGAFRGSEG
jgi:2-dehydro-3-deoxyglucarate aldolase